MGKISNKKDESCKTFHRFPDLTSPIGQKWVEFVRSKLLNPNWTPERSHKLCSRHFSEHSFISNPVDKRRTLKENAIPTKLILPQTEEPETDGMEWNEMISEHATSRPALHNHLALPDSGTFLKDRIKKLKVKIKRVEKVAVRRLLAINSQQERSRKLEKSRDEIMSKLMVSLQKEHKYPKNGENITKEA